MMIAFFATPSVKAGEEYVPPLSLVYPTRGTTLQHGEPLDVVFVAAIDCTAALYLDGILVFSVPVVPAQNVSVHLDSLEPGELLLSLRAVLPGASGTTFESAEVAVRVRPRDGQGSAARPGASTGAKRERDPRTHLPLCDDPLAAFSAEGGGVWVDDW